MTSTSNQIMSSFQCPIHIDFHPTNTSNLTAAEAVVPPWIPFAVINAVTSPFTVLINFLVIWTVLEKEQLRSNNYYLLVAILSLGDLLVGLVVQPLLVALIVGIKRQYSHVCELTLANLVLTLLWNVWSLVAMVTVSLERYLFIEHPLYYHTSVTSKKVTIAVISSWVIAVISTALTRVLGNEYSRAIQLPLILIIGSSFVIILFCVTKINLTARRQMRAIAALQYPRPAAQQSKIKEYKRSFTLGLIVLANVACLCPIIILRIATVVKGNGWNNDFRHHLSQIIYCTCLNFQSLVNPIIYALRLSDIRTGITKKLCCK